jgi:hypothetical protein
VVINISEDLLDEISKDPEFKATTSSEQTLIDRRLGMLELQVEALQLLLRVKEVFNEKLYQLAINHVVDLMEYCAKEKPTLDEAFFEKSKEDFIKKAKYLEIIKDE